MRIELRHAIYTPDWKERVRDYFARGRQFAAASGYWAFDFERQWAKHRRRPWPRSCGSSNGSAIGCLRWAAACW